MINLIKKFSLLLAFFLINKAILACETTIPNEKKNQVIKITELSPVTFHGFSHAHAAGFKGEGQIIAFIEQASPDHPQFFEGQMTQIDLSHTVNHCGLDKSPWRYSKEGWPGHNKVTTINSLINSVGKEGGEKSPTHGNHVIGIAIGQPGNYPYQFEGNRYEASFEGGCCPKAKALSFANSNLYPSNNLLAFHDLSVSIPAAGLCIYTLDDVLHNIELGGYKLLPSGILKISSQKLVSPEDENYKRAQWIRQEILKEINQFFPEQDKEFLKIRKIDDSTLLCFQEFFSSPSKILNCSCGLMALSDPLNDFKIPDTILNYLADNLEEKDKILILSANNQGQNLSEYAQQNYFKCFANHPKLKERFLIAVNIVAQNKDDTNYGAVYLPNGNTMTVGRGWLSNWPGERLKDFTVCALGNTLSGYALPDNLNGACFEVHNGTSEAAPVVASLCALIMQKDGLNGAQTVQRIKSTSIRFGNPDYTGCGFIWAPNALGLLR